MDDTSRRAFLLTGLGLLVTGCTGGTRDKDLFRGSTSVDRLTDRHTNDICRPKGVTSNTVARPKRVVTGPAILPRSAWADSNPMPARLDPMNGINSLTVHHEGMPTPTTCTQKWDVIRELRQVRGSHIRRMTAGDIGYHYVIDRTGRIWEGRPLRYQGAHVKYNNYHNIGVMVMGNFERQYPTSNQVASLDELLGHLMGKYSVPVSRVYTHRELRATVCPGRYLQPKVDAFRSSV